jgi:hypothetical protein
MVGKERAIKLGVALVCHTSPISRPSEFESPTPPRTMVEESASAADQRPDQGGVLLGTT